MRTKQLVLLHNNDLHGDFFPRKKGGKDAGGLPLLSGYVNRVRKEDQNVLYAIAGDVFQGSIIDQEYRGISTIDLINQLNPDVMTIGNHEVDYGLSHLLFLEKCANFPIINANLYVTLNGSRLFLPYLIKEVNGMKVLFIGLLTEEVIAVTRQDKVIGTLVDVEQAVHEIELILDSYRTVDIDLTILLTHIGIEKDRELAEHLDSCYGVDLIIGGHSHTMMEQPEYVNGIWIAQAGSGTGQIGRFDLICDTDTNSIADLRWQCVPVNEETAEPDQTMQELLKRYQSLTDSKYARVITTFQRKLTHPCRTQETELGNLYADLLQRDSSFDLMILGSGSIRKEELGPVVTFQDMKENTPFDDCLWMLKVSGEQLRRMIAFVFRKEAWCGHTEFYQYSQGMHIVWDRQKDTFRQLCFHGSEIRDGDEFTICLQDYHFRNFDQMFSVKLKEVTDNMEPRIIAGSLNHIVEEYMTKHQGLNAEIEGRIEVI